MSTNQILGWIVGSLALIAATIPIAVCAGCSGIFRAASEQAESRSPEDRLRSQLSISAGYQAEKAVRSRLKSPSSAIFDPSNRDVRYDKSSKIVTVSGTYTAKNSFGVDLAGRYVFVGRVRARADGRIHRIDTVECSVE